ncbi:MAG: hypothetical protein JO205_13610 [Pseudolabrys sp.]|nr:hypothetical protein [Pseudolabrys sp.]MBV9262397.1 hypothetical protein [Pseudolabrys sp.]
MSLLWRIIVILFGLWIATMAAGLVWSIGLLGSEWTAANADPAGRVIFWGAAFLASGITATLLFLPMLISVVLAEAFSLRSLLIYAVGGAALTLFGFYGTGFGNSYEESIDRAPAPISHQAEVAAAAGAAFGLAYWLIAGRNAGKWRASA